MPTTGPKHLYHALDAARGMAALAVVVHHIPDAVRGSAFASAYLAVDFFFCLSGFVLGHAYGNALSSGTLGVGQFMRVRLLRLYPLYLLALVLQLLLTGALLRAGVASPWSLKALLAKLPFAVALLPSPSLDWNAYLYSFNIPAWSILFELIVNLLYAALARSLLKPAALWGVIAVSGVLMALHVGAQGDPGGATWHTLAWGLPRVCFSFFVGVWIHRRHAAADAAPRRQGRVALSLLALLVLLLAMPDAVALEFAIIYVVSPLLVLLLARCELPTGPVGHLLRRLGVLSYAIYMLHSVLLRVWEHGARIGWITPQHWMLSALGLLLTVILVSALADRWFDTPVRRRLQTWLLRRPPVAQPTSTP